MKITRQIFGGRFVGRVSVEDSIVSGSVAGWEECRRSSGEDEVGINNKFSSFFFNVVHLF